MTGSIFGVVEGFYRRPYTYAQRLDLIDFLREVELNTYVYGPKCDTYHRRHWQKKYPGQKLREFEKLNKHCRERSIRFVYALSPVGKANAEDVIEKIDSLIEAGITHFGLFFDDIKVRLSLDTAHKQLLVANGLYRHLLGRLNETSLCFCPTQYRGFEATEYVTHIAANLHEDIDIFWTGRKVVSYSITARDVARITELLKRPVLIWDNLFANDYIPGKILRFPYRRRSPEILKMVRGVLLNPMNNYTESKPLIRTAAMFFHDPENYDTRRAWKTALNYPTNSSNSRNH